MLILVVKFSLRLLSAVLQCEINSLDYIQYQSKKIYKRFWFQNWPLISPLGLKQNIRYLAMPILELKIFLFENCFTLSSLK